MPLLLISQRLVQSLYCEVHLEFAQTLVALAGPRLANTNTCAVWSNPGDNTNGSHSAREIPVYSGSHRRLRYSL